MLDNNFWIVGGQHKINAMKKVMTQPTLANKKNIMAYCDNHETIMVWSLDKEREICTCPKC